MLLSECLTAASHAVTANRATIAAVIPCYNHGRFVADAVRSCLAQPGVDLRSIVIVDDGSDDGTTPGACDACRELPGAAGRVHVIHQTNGGLSADGASGGLSSGDLSSGSAGVVRRRAARIVRLADNVAAPSNREQVLIDRLVRSQGRGAISRAADDLWESKITVPKCQEIQIQLLEHENEIRARDAVFAMAELLQREAPIKRPVLDQRLRRLETSAEDPITRDAAGALRRSMRVHHGL